MPDNKVEVNVLVAGLLIVVAVFLVSYSLLSPQDKSYLIEIQSQLPKTMFLDVFLTSFLVVYGTPVALIFSILPRLFRKGQNEIYAILLFVDLVLLFIVYVFFFWWLSAISRLVSSRYEHYKHEDDNLLGVAAAILFLAFQFRVLPEAAGALLLLSCLSVAAAKISKFVKLV